MSRHLSDDEIVELLKATDTVPEPSPLFWEHAARRVRAAVDAEAPRRFELDRPAPVDRRRACRGVDCGAARVAAAPCARAAQPGGRVARAGKDDVTGLDEDSWTFVASLSEDFDVDAAARAGLLAPGESTDRAMLALDAGGTCRAGEPPAPRVGRTGDLRS